MMIKSHVATPGVPAEAEPDITRTHLYETARLRITVDEYGICGLMFKEELRADDTFIDELDDIEQVEVLCVTHEGAAFKLDTEELVPALTSVIKVVEALVTRQKA